MSNTEKFDKAIGEVTQERGKVYGSPYQSFKRIAAMKKLVQDCEDPAIRHALEMICVKMVRIMEATDNDHLDSVIDIAGYARTIAMVIDERVDDGEVKPEPRGYVSNYKCDNCGLTEIYHGTNQIGVCSGFTRKIDETQSMGKSG